MKFKYTNTLEEFVTYCDELLLGFLKRYVPEGIRQDKVRECYEYEMNLILDKVNKDGNLVRSLWLACLFGMLSKKYDLNINLKHNSFPLTMYLLHLSPYYLFEDGYIGIDYKYPDKNVSVTEFEVGKEFYQICKHEIELFFENTGYEYMELNATGCFDVKTTLVNTRLDGDIENQRIRIENVKGFEITWEELANESFLTEEEKRLLNYYKPQTEKMIRNVLGFVMSSMEVNDVEIGRWLIEENVTSREDLFDRLCYKWKSVEAPVYWEKVIRKGQFKEIYQRCKEYDMAKSFTREEVIAFNAIKYLPSRWDVLTKFTLYKRCVIQKRILP